MHSSDPFAVQARFRECTFDGYDPGVAPDCAKALAKAREVAEGRIANLVLVGRTGVGKTHLLAAAAMVWATRTDHAYRQAQDTERTERATEIAGLAPWEKFRSRLEPPGGLRWVNVPEVIAELRAEMDRPPEEDEPTMARRLIRLRDHRGLVVLDDLGREKVSDWTAETVYALVNGRYEAMLPTAVSSNLSAKDLAASVYWPAISRLAQDGALVQIDAPDYRLHKPPAKAPTHVSIG